MNKRLLKTVGGFLTISALFASCESNYSNESNCPILMGVPATDVTGPVEAAINEEITLNVSYKSKVNCSDFKGFYRESLASQRTVTPNVTYDACACKDSVVSVRTEAFKLKETTAGVYEFKFRKEDDDFISHTITVGDATTN